MNNLERVKKNVKWVVLVLIVIILYVLFAIFFGKKETVSSNNYLLIGNSLIWHEKNGKMYQETKVSNDLLQQKFVVFDGINRVNVDNLKYSDQQWYFFDTNYKQLAANNYRVAYSGNLKIRLANYSLEFYDDNDDQYIEEVAEPESAEQFDRYRKTLNKVNFDFDGDGSIETLYTITSTILDVVNYSFHSYMFLVDDDNVISQVQTTGSNPLLIEEVLDLDNDDKFEIVVSKGILDNPTLDACYQIYKIDENKIKLSQDCLFNK